MFSRYTNYNIPKNYSGNRFQANDAYETSTKTHTYDEYGAISSSVSPTYEERNTVAIQSVDNDVYLENGIEDMPEESPLEPENLPANQGAKSETSPSVFETLGDIFSKISSEDLLILCIIIFFQLTFQCSDTEEFQKSLQIPFHH